MFSETIRRINTKERRNSGVWFLTMAEGVRSRASVEEMDLDRWTYTHVIKQEKMKRDNEYRYK